MTGTVLFVDDEQEILEALARIFSVDDDLRVLTATSGENALGLLEKESIDLVVSDRMMPGMDGITLLSLVRDRYPEVALMMLTGYGQEMRLEEAFGESVPVFEKPWDLDVLRRAVRDAVGLTAAG